MKIGDYLVENRHITLEALNKALEIQSRNKNQRIGEILVEIGSISDAGLHKHIKNFLKDVIDANLGDWLSQDEADKFMAEIRSLKKNKE